MSKTTKATLNFANINSDALATFNNCQLAVNALALAEKALKDKRDDLGDNLSKEEVKQKTSKERDAVKACKERATIMCTTAIIRYVSTEDAIECNLYHFDMDKFLRNIGVLTGDLDKKICDKISKYRNLVVNRVKYGICQRKKGSDKLTLAEDKEVKNSPIDLVLALIMAMVNSGAIEYSNGGIAVKDFAKSADTDK